MQIGDKILVCKMTYGFRKETKGPKYQKTIICTQLQTLTIVRLKSDKLIGSISSGQEYWYDGTSCWVQLCDVGMSSDAPYTLDQLTTETFAQLTKSLSCVSVVIKGMRK